MLSLERIIGILRRQWPVIADRRRYSAAGPNLSADGDADVYGEYPHPDGYPPDAGAGQGHGIPNTLIDPGFVDSQVEI